MELSRILKSLLLLFALSEAARRYCELLCGYDNPVCQAKYRSCGFAENCPQVVRGNGLMENERIKVLDLHNKKRDYVAAGKETRGGNGQASNIRVLVYAPELEFLAQCTANFCRNHTDYCRDSPNFNSVGQNVYFGRFSANALGDAVEEWYSEVKYSRRHLIRRYSESFPPFPDYSRFTQLVWADTRYLGCGKTVTINNVYVVCNYANSGNVQKAPVYKFGDHCSDCYTKPCNKNYTNLCDWDFSEQPKNFTLPFTISFGRGFFKRDWLLLNVLLFFIN